MAEQRGERANPNRSGPASLGLGLLAVLLVLAVVAGRARARGTVPHVAGPTGGAVVDTITVLGITVLTAGVVLLVWGRWIRRVRASPRAGTRRRAVTDRQRVRVVAAVLIGFLGALAYHLAQRAPEPLDGEPPSAPDQPILVPTAEDLGLENIQPHVFPQTGLGSYLSAVGVLAALVALAVVLLRRDQVEPATEDPEPGREREAVAKAVAAGHAAVTDRAVTDTRAAIVACFAAMETALRGFGQHAAPRGSDTPTEVLRRGMANAGLPERPAGEMLALFHRARFSPHPMRAEDRAIADRALRELLSTLRGANTS